MRIEGLIEGKSRALEMHRTCYYVHQKKRPKKRNKNWPWMLDFSLAILGCECWGGRTKREKNKYKAVSGIKRKRGGRREFIFTFGLKSVSSSNSRGTKIPTPTSQKINQIQSPLTLSLFAMFLFFFFLGKAIIATGRVKQLTRPSTCSHFWENFKTVPYF